MKRPRFTLRQCLAAAIILASSAAAAETTPGTLTLTAATRETLTNNPAIRSAWRKWQGLRERIVQEKAWADPTISADFTGARFVDVPPNAFTDQSITLEQLIPISGKNLSRGRAAAAEAVAAYEVFRRQQLDVISQLRAAWFQLQNARAQLLINGQNATSLQQIAAASRAKYQAGSEIAPNVLAAEIEADKIDEQRHDLERAASEAQTQLNVLMNRPASSPIGEVGDPKPVFPPLSENDLLNRLLQSRPEVRIARANIDAERARLQLAKRAWIPDPSVNVNVQRYNESSQTVSQVGTGISFNIPWVNPGKYSAAIREAADNVDSATDELQSAQSIGMGLLHDQYLRIETAHHHYELYRGKILPQAQQAFDTIQSNYQSGKATFTDWITAQRTLQEVEGTVSDMLTDYETSIAQLDAIVGTELSPSPAQGSPPHHPPSSPGLSIQNPNSKIQNRK